MPAILEIRDVKAEGGLAFGIRELLDLVPAEGQDLWWSIFPVYGEIDIVHHSERQYRTVKGLQSPAIVTWEDMSCFANTVSQTIWGTYIGCRDAAAFADLTALHGGKWLYLHQATPAYYEAIDIAFQAVDGGFWFVYA